jgi:hypothetical protein
MRPLLLAPALSVLCAFAQDMPRPTAHHLAMKAAEGTWDAVVKSYAPGQPPAESKGVEVNKIVAGGLWMQSDFTSQMMGMAFEGHGLFGFDPATGKHVGTWVDNVSASQSLPVGICKEGCKEVTSTFELPGPGGQAMKFREVSKQLDADHRHMAMWIQGKDGKDMLMMEISYTRRK